MKKLNTLAAVLTGALGLTVALAASAQGEPGNMGTTGTMGNMGAMHAQMMAQMGGQMGGRMSGQHGMGAGQGAGEAGHRHGTEGHGGKTGTGPMAAGCPAGAAPAAQSGEAR